jgi:hypothetical protein
MRTAVRKAIKGLNQKAGSYMAKGDYTAAEALAAKGRALHQFTTEVEALRKRWKEVRSGGQKSGKRDVTPLWGFYQPILRALAQSGGQAAIRDLETGVEAVMGATLLPGDHAQLSRGRERWRVMVQRARKHLVSEGWIENRRGAKWSITESGRRAAEKTSSA